jgi:hypothetical protein
MKTGGEADSAGFWIHLGVAELIVGVGGHDNVCVFNYASESLVRFLAVEHELEEASVELVHGHNRSDSLSKRLAKHSLRLNANALNSVNNDKGAVGDAEGGCDLTGEVNVAGAIDEINQIAVALALASEAFEFVGAEFIVEGDAGAFNGDGAVLLIVAGIGQPLVASILDSNDASGSDEGVSESTL